MTTDNLLGQFLRDRRSRLDPVAFGFPAGRRRTPGLRREEVAQRSNISPTWYTWLEQGRGGAPSADVLERLARGLMLTPVEREHLFIIGLGRPPEVHYKAVDGVTPRLQRLLDALETSPALVKTATWDVVAWNRAAALVLTDYAALPPGRRNILRLMFGDPRVKAAQHDWEGLTRFVVGAFRADAARAGASSEIGQLVDELCQLSPEFAALWRDNDVREHGEGVKRLTHPLLGLIELEFSAFAVDGRTDLSMIVYNPVDRSVADRIRALTRNAVHPKTPSDIRQEPSMREPLQYQLRVYLGDQDAATARVDRRSPCLAPLTKILDRHDATLVCQLDAFEAYVAQAETAGALEDPLYKWTKATVQNPAMRAKHGGSFAIRVGGEEVYAKPLADALESELSPIVGGGIVQRMSRHDTDPAKNIPIPAEYRAPRS